MVERTMYLDELERWKHKELVKVITGIRRCGKSTLLKQFIEKLKSEGVSDDEIVFVNFEELDNEELLDYKALNSYVTEKIRDDRWTYVFFDEIQSVENFQKVVDSLYVKPKTDIYITGSNAYLLSGELATLLSGRYVEISMLPFSFREYLETRPGKSPDEAFPDYLRFGGFPYTTALGGDPDMTRDYLDGIYNTIIVKDVEIRQGRRNAGSPVDTSLLRRVSRYLVDVTGSQVSMKGTADFITSSGRKVTDHTITDYVSALVEAFVFYRADRFDISGKELLKNNGKFYLVDPGLRLVLTAKRQPDTGHVLENVVFLELIRRGYTVNVGKLDTKEIDFVARESDVTEYIQVTTDLTDENTFRREISPLKSVKSDNYPRTILTLDKYTSGDYDGITVKNVVDWLLNWHGLGEPSQETT